jgi:CCR4-NOT transcription complex subunit 9
MMPSQQHVYGGHHQYNAQVEPAWMHQQSTHQHRAQQAAAAAASAAQQQHYNHIAAAHSTANGLSVAHGQEEMTVSEDNRRTLAYVADLLNDNTREAALLELSKKREQVPELALILWHSFGMAFMVEWPEI